MNKLAVILTALVSAQIQSAEVTIFSENETSFPWIVKESNAGLNFILLDLVDKKIPEVEFVHKRVPWKRCLNAMKQEEFVDSSGCFSASYKEVRKEFGVYPGGDSPNSELRLHSSSYSLYTKKSNQNVGVAGKLTIDGLGDDAKIAAPAGYSISSDLASKGYKVDDQSKNTKANFQKLLSGRVEAVTALTESGDFHLDTNPKYQADIQKLTPPLVNKPYYLMLSHGFVKKNPEIAEKIWATIAEVRESEEYKTAGQEWMKTNTPSE